MLMTSLEHTLDQSPYPTLYKVRYCEEDEYTEANETFELCFRLGHSYENEELYRIMVSFSDLTDDYAGNTRIFQEIYQERERERREERDRRLKNRRNVASGKRFPSWNASVRSTPMPKGEAIIC